MKLSRKTLATARKALEKRANQLWDKVDNPYIVGWRKETLHKKIDEYIKARDEINEEMI